MLHPAFRRGRGSRSFRTSPQFDSVAAGRAEARPATRGRARSAPIMTLSIRLQHGSFAAGAKGDGPLES